MCIRESDWTMVGQPPARLSVRRSRPERPFSRRLRGVKLAATAARAARLKAELDAQRSRRLWARCASPPRSVSATTGLGPALTKGYGPRSRVRLREYGW